MLRLAGSGWRRSLSGVTTPATSSAPLLTVSGRLAAAVEAGALRADARQTLVARRLDDVLDQAVARAALPLPASLPLPAVRAVHWLVPTRGACGTRARRPVPRRYSLSLCLWVRTRAAEDDRGWARVVADALAPPRTTRGLIGDVPGARRSSGVGGWNM